jgi:branched-chain amino acid transport system permease protein
MRFLFKTSYDQDIRLAKHGGHRFWYGALLVALFAAPWFPDWLLGAYGLSQLTQILIYGIVGLGLMLLAGFTGLFSIGHAAFLGVGAYTQAVLAAQGWPFPLSLAAARRCRPSSAPSSGCRRCASRASTWASPRWPSASSSRRCWRAGRA